MKISARNQLTGTIRKISTGPVNAEVVLILDGGTEIVAVITSHSAKALGLKKGMQAVAVVKSSDVMIGLTCGNPACECRD